MNQSSFNFRSKIQDIEVKPNDVTGVFDGLKSFLSVPIHFIYRPPQNEWGFDVISITLSEKNVFPGTCVAKECEVGENFRFELDERTISTIENQRGGGDITFYVDLSIVVAMNSITKPANYRVVQSEGAYRDTASVYFTIPKSIWVERILSSLGYQAFKLIQIPLTHKALKEAYSDIISEFNSAENYFNQQDYNKCVAHCRHTLDALHRNLKKVKAQTPSESAFKWLEGLDAATLEWLDKMDKANGAQTNKTHHSGLKRDFTRYEAESIYLVTLGLLNFIAYLK
jgi:hypothetical protein